MCKFKFDRETRSGTYDMDLQVSCLIDDEGMYEDVPAKNVAITLEFDFVIGRPAKTDGPPERCYPAEDFELTITDVTCAETMHQELADAMIESQRDKLEEYLSEKVQENY